MESVVCFVVTNCPTQTLSWQIRDENLIALIILCLFVYLNRTKTHQNIMYFKMINVGIRFDIKNIRSIR